MTTQGTTTGEKSPLAEAGDDVGQSAGHIAEKATDVGFQQADKGREQAAEAVDQLAGSIRRVSTDMQGEQPMIANAAMTAAEQTERIATFLRDTDARELIGTVEDVARKQPILFLGGAFLLGFAASRFLKAGNGGQQQSQQQQMGGGYRSGYDTSYRSGTTADWREPVAAGVNGRDEGF